MLSELAKKIRKNAEKARQDGFQEGFQKAYQETKLKIAKTMMLEGLPLETAIHCTGLTEEQLARETHKDNNP